MAFLLYVKGSQVEIFLSYDAFLSENLFLSPRFFKKASGILQSPPSVRPSVRLSVRLSVRPSVTLSPPKPLDEIQPNLVCGLLT